MARPARQMLEKLSLLVQYIHYVIQPSFTTRWVHLQYGVFSIGFSTNRYGYYTPHYSTLYVEGSGPIILLLSNVSCNGSESQLLDCPYETTNRYCNHSLDAELYCTTCEYASDKYKCYYWSKPYIESLTKSSA